MTETEAEAWRAWGLWEMLAKLQPENYGWSSRCPGEMGLWGFRQDCGGERRRGIGIYGQTREQIGNRCRKSEEDKMPRKRQPLAPRSEVGTSRQQMPERNRCRRGTDAGTFSCSQR